MTSLISRILLTAPPVRAQIPRNPQANTKSGPQGDEHVPQIVRDARRVRDAVGRSMASTPIESSLARNNQELLATPQLRTPNCAFQSPNADQPEKQPCVSF